MKISNTGYFVCLIMAFILSACGQKQSGKTLKVTTALTLGSAGFTGGLIVHGKSSDGKRFVANAIGGTSLVVTLDNGTWTINVAGWDGAGTFSGNVHCGTSTVTLSPETTIINVSASIANCSGATFTAGKSGLADATTGFRDLTLFNCKSLYHLDGGTYQPITSTTPGADLNGDFCTSAETPPGFTKSATAVKFIVDGNQTPGATFTNLSTPCHGGISSAAAIGIKLPANGIPFRVQLFDNLTCDGEGISYNFPDGFIAGNPEFDSVVNNLNPLNYYNLVLPFNDLRRGYSPLVNSLPSITCSGLDCLPQPGSIPSDYFLYSNGGYQKVKLSEATSCSQVVVTGTSDLLIQAAPDHCEEKDGSVYLNIQPDTPSSCITPCPLTITINGSPVTKTFLSDQNKSTERNAYDDIWRVFGNSGTPTTFFDFFSHDDTNEGVIGHAREELGPGGILSLFGHVSCSSIIGQKTVTLHEDGEIRSYVAEATTSSASIPKLICDNMNPNPSTCANSTFDKKIVLRRKVGTGWSAEQVMHLDCDNPIGLLESQHVRLEDTDVRTHKYLIGWNTGFGGMERAESLAYERTESSGGALQEERTSFQRAEISASEFKGQILGYSSWYEDTTTKFREYLSHRDFYSVAGELNAHHKNIELSSSTAKAIFDIPYFPQFFQVPFLARDSYQATSPDNTKMLRIWTEFDGSNHKAYLSSFDGSWTHPASISTFISSASPGTDASIPRVAVKNDGDAVVAWREVASTIHSLKLKTRNAGIWASPVSIQPTTFGGAIEDIDVCVDGNLAAVVWSQLDTNVNKKRIHVAYSTDFGSGNTWINPVNAYTESFSTSGDDSTKPRCALESTSSKIFVTYSMANNIVVTHSTLSTLATTVSSLSSNGVPANPSGTNPVEAFIRREADKILVSYYDPGSQKVFKSIYLFATPGWTHPVSLSSGVPIRLDSDFVLTKDIISDFGNLGTYMGTPPNGLKVPAYNNLKARSHFNMKELHPDRVNAIFTNYNTFKAQ